MIGKSICGERFGSCMCILVDFLPLQAYTDFYGNSLNMENRDSSCYESFSFILKKHGPSIVTSCLPAFRDRDVALVIIAAIADASNFDERAK